MKYEWKKQDRSGNPNDQDFSNKVAALYAFAYAIKMGYKAAATVGGNEVHDFSVYPLEGVWNLKRGDKLIKEELEYTIMIRQPNFITQNMLDTALERVKWKKKIANINLRRNIYEK